MDNYIDLPAGASGGAAGVSSLNTLTGALTLVAGSGISITPFGTTLTINADPVTGNINTFAGFDGSGNIESVPGFFIDTTTGGMNEQLTEQPDGNSSGYSVNSLSVGFDPLQNSPDENWLIANNYANLDVNSSGFSQGTTGNALTMLNQNINHQGTGDVGALTFCSNSFNIGNGTDAINVKGIAYAFGFGQINANVNINGPIQGYGFQPNINSSATIDDTIYINAFYDYSNFPLAIPGYNSFIAGPNISSITNNHNYTSFSTNPSIGTLVGNAGHTGVGIYSNITTSNDGGVTGVQISPTVGTMNNGGFTGVGIFPNITTTNSGGMQGVAISPNIGTMTGSGFTGVNINPTIGLNNNYTVGLDVNMDNVTNNPGASASLVVQDITITLNAPGNDGNNITVEYTDTVTAGNEVCTFSYPNIVVSIESGVSTATQVLAAYQANVSLISNASIVLTGVGSNPQVTYAQTNLAGGVNPGTSKAANFKGDVSIDGALSFTGGLSIGALSSFANVDISGYPGGVNSIDTLITSPTIADNTTLNTDLLAVNTAMLLTIGSNVTATSSFLGYTALGLPAVLSMGIGSTIDRVTGASFALSLDGAAAGGTVDEVDLCRSLAIPNGVTTVNKLYGYKFDLPFGDPGTTTWGLYSTPTTAHNFVAGDLVIGDVDVPTNSSVGLELNSTTKAILSSRMTTIERDALTAVNGMVLYNTDTDKLQVRAAGVWVDLH